MKLFWEFWASYWAVKEIIGYQAQQQMLTAILYF